MEILKIIVWPSAAVLLVIACCLIFMGPIRRLIDRVRTVRLLRAAIDAPIQEPERVTEKSSSAAESLRRRFDNQLLLEDEKTIREDPQFSSISDPGEREHLLIRLYSGTRIALYFEQLYNFIWGTQLEALEQLNTVATVGFEIEHLRNLYETRLKTQPELSSHHQSFEKWLDFLIIFRVIERQEDRVLITLLGREFLKYLLERGYTTKKVL